MTPSHTSTVDRYLEAIYCIAAEGEVVRPSRLTYWLDVSAPTVSDAVQRLKRDGWVEIASDRSITLTETGDRVATEIVRRHRILERWLTDSLGFDWAAADVEADRLSSAMSNEVVAQIDASMNFPSTCPHGNVIPGRDSPYGVLIALADLEPGTPGTIRRISEVAEHEARALLLMLAEHDIHEGSQVAVTETDLGANDVEIVIGGKALTLGIDAARLIWVDTEE
jgi:DtxR family transcriptional regulator, Mn-dependent transcriptional regulator